MLRLFVIIVLLLFGNLNAERLYINIEFKGLKVADVEINYNQDEISVFAKSTLLANLFSYRFENSYIINTNENFIPDTYIKKVNQHNFTENTVTIYDYNALKAVRKDLKNGELDTFRIFDDTRDFFSALFYLRKVDLFKTNTFTIDNVGKISKITSRFLSSESIKTPLGLKKTIKVAISFELIDEKPSGRSDILTNNLVKPENTLLFWFTEDDQRIPVKAIYTMKKLSVNWFVKEIK